MLTIRLLGELALEGDDGPLEPPARRHGRLLLAYLALHPGLHGRGDLARLLWPDVLDSSARSSLRSALSSVRRALGENADRYLAAQRDRLGLAADAGITVDVLEFRALVEHGRREDAAARGRGTLLQGFDDDWVDQAREHHRAAVGEVLAGLASTAEANGDLGLAVRYAREHVALDPLAEGPARELIRRLAAAGDRAAALAAYARLSDAFRTQLRSAPSAQTRELVARVRAADDEAGEARWAPPPLQPALRAHLAPSLVGRAPELAVLRAALAQAEAGERQTVTVGGEPGIGKSALLASFAEEAAAQATVLFGRGSGPSAPAFGPLVDALRHYAATTPASRLRRELPEVTGHLVGLIPELERAFEPPVGASDVQLGEDGRTLRILVDALLGICAEHTLVLIVDDVHDADPGSLRALAHLIAVSDVARLMIVLVYRDTELADVEPTLRRLRRLASTHSLLLAPLDEQDTGRLASSAAGAPLSHEEVTALHRRSRGNPLFAEELARQPASSGALPERVADLILDELGRLGSPTRRVLATASALGHEFELATVVQAMDETAETCLDALDDAVAAKAIRELPGSVGRYQFRHPLIRETLYQALTATRRAHLHLRIAGALEAAGDPRATRAVAEHLVRARELVPRSRLAEATLRAAHDAAEAQAHDDAARLYERAAALAESEDERIRLLLEVGHARRRAGQTDIVRETFRHAAALAERAGEPALLAEAALGLCSAPDFASEQAIDDEAVAVLERALAALGDDDRALQARVLAQLASERYASNDHALVSGLVERAQGLAHDSGDPAARAAALDAAHMIRRGGGDPRERLVLVDQLFEIARAGEDPERLALAHVRRAADLFELGDFAGVGAERVALSALAAELRQPTYLWWTRLWQATQAIFEGAPEGEDLARRAYATGRAAFGGAAELELGAQTFWLRLEAGRLTDDGPRLYAALERYPALPAARCALARIDAELGRLDRAADALEELTGPALDALRHEAGWPISAALLAEVCARVGDDAAARRLATATAPAADRWATSAFGSLCLGPLSASLALVCAVAGTWDEAEHWYEHAQARCATAGAAPAAARLTREFERLAAVPAARAPRRPTRTSH